MQRGKVPNLKVFLFKICIKEKNAGNSLIFHLNSYFMMNQRRVF